MQASARGDRWTLAVIGLWLACYPALLLANHFSLRSNAFDLSVFDYALWSSLHGRFGYVPFMGQSLFAQHFMPTLLALLPVYAIWQSPVLLILVQLAAMLAAAVLLWKLAADKVPAIVGAAFVAAFLFSRRAHSAEISVFYVECLEPLLVFGLVLAAANQRWRTYFLLLALALGCKEDMPIYLAGFGLLLAARRGTRWQGLGTGTVCALWLAAALLVAIPSVRAASGLAGANPFIEARYDSGGSLLTAAARRVLSAQSAARVVTLSSTVAFTAWASPEWLAIAVPGIAIDLAARPDSLQSGVTGHYLWPILPWLFISGVFGAGRVIRLWPRSAGWLAAVLFLATIADAPLRQALLARPWADLPAAARVRSQLALLPPDAPLLAQPNVIPHVAHRADIEALGRPISSDESDRYVVVCSLGDQWPFSAQEAQETIARLREDSRLRVAVASGPLTVFAPSARKD